MRGWHRTPPGNPSSPVADSQFRKDWVSENFTGGPLKAGGFVNGDDDSYSYGCAILFIYYLKDQLGFSMSQIVKMVRRHWMTPTVSSPTGAPMRSGDSSRSWTDTFPSARSSPQTTHSRCPKSLCRPRSVRVQRDQGILLLIAVRMTGSSTPGEIFWARAAMDSPSWTELPDRCRACSGSGGGSARLSVRRGQGPGRQPVPRPEQLGQAFVGWQDVGFQSKVAAGAAASGETTAVVAVDLRGVVSYSYWDIRPGWYVIRRAGRRLPDRCRACSGSGGGSARLSCIGQGPGRQPVPQPRTAGPGLRWMAGRGLPEQSGCRGGGVR